MKTRRSLTSEEKVNAGPEAPVRYKYGGTALDGRVLSRHMLVGADSRTRDKNDVIIAPVHDRGVKTYQKEDHKKVAMCGDLVVGMAGSSYQTTRMHSLLSDKIERLDYQGKQRPTVYRCMRFLFACAKRFKKLKIKLKFDILLSGFDDKVPHMYHLQAKENGQITMNKVPKNIHLGTGSVYTRASMDSSAWRESEEVYDAVRCMYEGIVNAEDRDKRCGGLIRIYVIGEYGIECLKFPVEKHDRQGEPVKGREGFVSDGSWTSIGYGGSDDTSSEEDDSFFFL